MVTNERIKELLVEWNVDAKLKAWREEMDLRLVQVILSGMEQDKVTPENTSSLDILEG